MKHLPTILNDLPEGAVPVTEWTPRAFFAIALSLTGIALMIYIQRTNPEEGDN